MAGFDGIKNKIDPGELVDKFLYELAPEGQHDLPTVPGSLDESLAALKADQDFLLAGGVFAQDLLDMYISLKQRDVDALRSRPHPCEFQLYLDV